LQCITRDQPLRALIRKYVLNSEIGIRVAPGELQSVRVFRDCNFRPAPLRTMRWQNSYMDIHSVNPMEKNSAEFRRVKFLALGKKITDLLDFVKPKHNVHSDIKRMANSIRTLYDQLADMEESPPASRPNTTVASTQTSPGPKAKSEREAPETAVADTQTTPGLKENSERNVVKKRKSA
ncbi:hypothetical protein CBL_20247, partial [Carabus blaptoides fortunei]